MFQQSQDRMDLQCGMTALPWENSLERDSGGTWDVCNHQRRVLLEKECDAMKDMI